MALPHSIPAERIGPVAALALLCSLCPAWGQSSAQYALVGHAWSNSGQRSTSASFALTTTLSELVTGASSSHNAILQSGFWSFSGSGRIPVVLAVKRNVLVPEHCDLRWSGNDPRYEVYAGDCSDIFGSFYASTNFNGMWNVAPPDGSLVCFNVVPASSRPERSAGRFPPVEGAQER